MNPEESIQDYSDIGDLSSIPIGEILKNTSALSVFTTILCLIFLIIFIVVAIKSRNKRKREHPFSTELRSYLPKEKHTYSGTVLLTRSGVSYTRGNSYCGFEIPISKRTYLAPKLVDPWFNNRNYNLREAYVILEDIQSYLLDNGICREVKIVEDNEYDLYNEVNNMGDKELHDKLKNE